MTLLVVSFVSDRIKEVEEVDGICPVLACLVSHSESQNINEIQSCRASAVVTLFFESKKNIDGVDIEFT